VGGSYNELGEDLIERNGELPLGIVAAEATEVGDVADVIAHPRLLDVLGAQRFCDQVLEAPDGFEDRDAVWTSPAQVVDDSCRRALGKGDDRAADMTSRATETPRARRPIASPRHGDRERPTSLSPKLVDDVGRSVG
jgi:hypothetical protein